MFHGIGQREGAHEVAEVVGKHVKLEANGIVVEPAARQACPPDRVLALLDPLLSRTALIVERDHPLGGAAQVGDNEPDPRVQLIRMPLDLGDDAAGLVPGSGLITEAGMIPAHVCYSARRFDADRRANPLRFCGVKFSRRTTLRARANSIPAHRLNHLF